MELNRLVSRVETIRLSCFTGMGGLGRLATWHLPGGPVGLPSRWAATSNVEVGQRSYPVNRGRVVMEGREGRRGTK